MNRQWNAEAAVLRSEEAAFDQQARACARQGDHEGMLLLRAQARNCALMRGYLYHPPTSTFSHLDAAWKQIGRLRVAAVEQRGG